VQLGDHPISLIKFCSPKVMDSEKEIEPKSVMLE
jgi:hypothetical protein